MTGKFILQEPNDFHTERWVNTEMRGDYCAWGCTFLFKPTGNNFEIKAKYFYFQFCLLQGTCLRCSVYVAWLAYVSLYMKRFTLIFNQRFSQCCHSHGVNPILCSNVESMFPNSVQDMKFLIMTFYYRNVTQWRRHHWRGIATS